MQNRSHLLTEQRLSESMNLDSMSIEEAIALMNAQDRIALDAVEKERPNVVRAIQLVVEAFRNGGRLFYFGAGTSGRLGVLDASECPPTFRTEPDMVQGIIAGGPEAMFRAKEGAEDSPELGAKDVDALGIGALDVVMGIAAGGTTPYVHGALRRARGRDVKTIFLSCVPAVPNEPPVDVVIRPIVGAEILTGSTRLKAGTATKLVLNQLTTISMVQLGKCYENLMVDLRASNEKLWDRGVRIIQMIARTDREEALSSLKLADGHVKVAVIMQVKKLSLVDAKALLGRHDGILRVALAAPSK